MKGIDKTVFRETCFIAEWVGIFSVFMQAVFLIIGRWNCTVMFGNILGGTAAILNFFLMGLTVQASVSKNEKESKGLIKLSQKMRMVMLFAVAAVGTGLKEFNTIASLLPLFFPRIAIAMRPIFMREKCERGE